MSGLSDKIGTVGGRVFIIMAGLLAVSCSAPTVPAEPELALVSGEARSRSGMSVTSRGGLESEVVAGINRYRVARGRGGLVRDAFLDRLALEHSEAMARQGKMSHAGFSQRGARAEREGLVWPAENVMRGYGYHAEATLGVKIVDGWINSSSHRRNLLLRNSTHIGVGIVRGRDGSVWATQLSARRE